MGAEETTGLVKVASFAVCMPVIDVRAALAVAVDGGPKEMALSTESFLV